MASVPGERKLAAILSADVVGYSRLMAEDEAGSSSATILRPRSRDDVQTHGAPILRR